MSRRATRPNVRVSLWFALLMAACDGAPRQPTEQDASPPAARDAAADRDARPPARDAAAEPGADDAGWQPPLIRPLPDSVCTLWVGAECDGSEDCAPGESCCGSFDSTLLTYTRIDCRPSCDDRNDIELCHPGEACTREENVCRASLIIPHEFIGVCARPQPGLRPAAGQAVAGEVACGAVSCRAGEQKCCLRARYHFATLSLRALEPYCAELDDDCSCEHVPQMPDAGPPDAGSSDSGPPDAGPPDDEDGGV